MAPRLKEQYQQEIVPQLREKFEIKNAMQIPELDKIVINMGVGDGQTEPKLLEAAMNELAAITGQQPAKRLAKKSISAFRLREGMPIGCMVTLRGARMYEFLDRLVSVAIPRIRDFRGISKTAFDSHGNYTLGLTEQTIFPEINQDAVIQSRGMSITFVIKNSENAETSQEFLTMMGLPFRK